MTKKNWFKFLVDVFKTSLSSFGGPEAHYAVFIRKMAKEYHYVKEEEIKEWMGVFSLIPGPSSTQTMMAIGYSYGGPVLAFFTWIVWALPAMTILSFIAFLYPVIVDDTLWRRGLTYLPVLAIAFIAYAAIFLTQKVFKQQENFVVYGVVLLLAYLFQDLTFWVLPLLLVVTGIFVISRHREHWMHEKRGQKIKIPVIPIVIFVMFTIMIEGLRFLLMDPLWTTWFSFYRFGYSIIGGGQLVVPYMIETLFLGESSISLNVFLSGYSIDQAIPGPLFSFASFVGAFVANETIFTALGSGFVSGFMIFLPGILGVYIIFPVWKELRKRMIFQFFIQGVVIAVSALISLTAITQVVTLTLSLDVYMVFGISLLLLLNKKTNPIVLVLGVLLLGFIV